MNFIGKVDHGEDNFQAAMRETEEETGYTLNELNVYSNISKTITFTVGDVKKRVQLWPAELKDPQKKPTLSHEHTDYRWVTKDEAKSLNEHPCFSEMTSFFYDPIKSLPKLHSQ